MPAAPAPQDQWIQCMLEPGFHDVRQNKTGPIHPLDESARFFRCRWGLAALSPALSQGIVFNF